MEEGKELYETAKIRMKEGGFNLRKWKTNDQTLAEEFKCKTEEVKSGKCEQSDDTYVKEVLGAENSDSKTKVLGITWDMIADKFEFDLTKVGKSDPEARITKRSILSMIAKLFDPLGLVSPIIVSAKVLFQELCTMKLGWDDELPEQMQNRWKAVVSDLNSVGMISLPRCLYKKNAGEIKNCYLHGFSDASKKAYCAMVYLVYETEEGMHSRLICAKTRVAPLKELSIPRLELMSARILSTLMKTVYNALTPQVKIDGCKYWLDSKTTLFWINNQGEWRQFVQHRVNEILKITKKEEWGHCVGVCNPADLGSRGVSASVLKDSRLWWEGPHWLSMSKEHWPSHFPVQDSDEVRSEKKKVVSAMITTEQNLQGISQIVDIERFDSLGKLLRVTALVLRFIKNVKARKTGNEPKTGKQDAQEIFEAEKLWIKEAQEELQKQARYKNLVIQLGIFEDGKILRCKGRLGNSDLELESKYPIILPGEYRFTQLVIEDCHRRIKHDGLKATLTEYRTRFWTTKGRQYVKKVIGNCSKCKRTHGKSYGVPPVAPLPEFRVEQVPPFTNVGVDFAGPLYYKSKNGKMEKCYIVLYTCCTSRALHLDLVEDLSGPTFIRSLRRFTSRRGTSSLMNSDNAKTFKFTHKFLDKLARDHTVLSFLQERRITWRFNLEKSPWWGGYYERMVGSVKRCLKKVIGNARLTFDELSTVLVEVEGTLNSRPINVYDEVGIHPLTPSHLIYGRRLSQLADDLQFDEYDLDEPVANYTKRFWYLIKKLNHFSCRWKHEYLTELREFHKNHTDQALDVSTGDVVLIKEDNVKRNAWRMGQVVELIDGKDGFVRGAKVRTCGRGKPEILSRPLQKLFPLELSKERHENGGKGKELNKDANEEQGRNEEEPSARPKRAAAKDSQWKTHFLLDSA